MFFRILRNGDDVNRRVNRWGNISSVHRRMAYDEYSLSVKKETIRILEDTTPRSTVHGNIFDIGLRTSLEHMAISCVEVHLVFIL